MNPEVATFFDESTNTFSYVVKDPETDACAVIDSVLNFDHSSGAVSYAGADDIIGYIERHQLRTQWLIETHVHADHLSAAPYIQAAVGGKLAIGEHIHSVQEAFGKIFNEGSEFQRNGSQFDHLFTDGESYGIGNLQCRAIHTPGHTPACMVHVMDDAAFIGDTLFMPDGGTARADFPGGDARQLYQSVQIILNLPDTTRLFMCHDYAPGGREVEFQSTVAAQRERNIHVNQSVTEDSFVNMREARDRTLNMPKLIFPSLQVNMRAGHFPEPEDNQKVYLKIPINAFDN
ncbi:MBL fold metallo-hydrolase [Halieaceae bacterium IMCC8485]|uniref:MBL fold metallo-hydrolase n=1 Tax=Candidatus Seongchinamella marina TaxID=2518990 RepID=A0ABT3T1X8_9GAMM|nr:MBL fold metallo-hydrolase [Candidatus Seongchinamella marina]MCX2975524.1 MBL fold metallo-hydrolase [Candidatus Seongchinamella marina]